MKCESCFKRKAKQADTHLNMWLCDNCYSKFDSIYKTDEQLDNIDTAISFKQIFGKGIK